MNLVQVANVSKKYLLGNQEVHALKDVSLSVEEGVFLAIAGPSGSGKSTLLNLIGCIDTPSSGSIVVGGHDVSGQTPDELADLRARTIGFIFQTFNLLPVLSAAENVEYPLLQFPELSKKDRRCRVEKFLEVVDLGNYAGHRPNELSGGQRQRVAIARALATNAKIVLADEPTANLDHATGESILQLMREINRSSGTTFIFSTHDRRVMTMADRLVRIEDGAITSLGQRGSSKWLVVDERRAEAELANSGSAASLRDVERQTAKARSELQALDIDVDAQEAAAAGDAGNIVVAAPLIGKGVPQDEPERTVIDGIRREALARVAAAKEAAKKVAAEMVAAAMASAARESAEKLAAARAIAAQSGLTPLEIAARIAALDDELSMQTRDRMSAIRAAAVMQARQQIAAARRAIEQQAVQQIEALQKGATAQD